MKIVIISHTRHYKKNNKIVGWGPTVRELNYLSNISNELTHIAPLHKGIAPKSSLPYKNNIKYVYLKPSGGKFLKKLTILTAMPFNLWQIIRHIRNADYIQFRAPTGIGFYVLPLLKFSKKKYWVKYAGNWIDTNMPLGNKLQKWWLKNMLNEEAIVTINGNWEKEKKNIISFENPCITKEEYKLGKQIIQKKEILEKINFCFVGGLNEHKGVHLILQALTLLKDRSKIGTFHFVGDGPERSKFEKLAKNLNMNIKFHGFLKKDKINAIYSQSHFVVLPSKSEGFPKVIGEGMNFGCVPIVSNVSSIGQYIVENENGFLLNQLDSHNLVNIFKKALSLSNNQYKSMQQKNYQIAEKFTYEYYIHRVKNEILNKNY